MPFAWPPLACSTLTNPHRHGDLLNRYLYLTGRVDMRSVEVTIQHLITNGFNPKIKKDPYKGFIYTSFQERATKISHQNVARLANTAGACVPACPAAVLACLIWANWPAYPTD